LLSIAAMAMTISGCATKQLDCIYPQVGILSPILGSLAYPENGATGVATDIGSVLYYPLSSPLTIRLSDATTHVATMPGSVPSPLPSPIASPPYGNATIAASVVPTLAPQTQYDVQYQTTFTSGCPMKTTTGYVTLGSFTTQ
jgi:hypothetical protein